MKNKDYSVNIRPLTPEEGGGWLATIPELNGCMSDGETPEEALANLTEAKEAWLETAEKLGWKVPEPKSKPAFSGKLTLRIPRSLHQRLVDQAEVEGVSLNQHLVFLLAAGVESTERSIRSETGKSQLGQNHWMLAGLQLLLESTKNWSGGKDAFGMLPPEADSPLLRMFSARAKDDSWGSSDRVPLAIQKRMNLGARGGY